MRSTLALLALCLPLLAVTGCDRSTSTGSEKVDDLRSGGVAFRLSSTQVEALSLQVDSLVIRLSSGTETREQRVGLASIATVEGLQPGPWVVEVLLVRGGIARYAGSTQVTIVLGRTTQARVVLRPAGGDLDLEIVIDSTGSGSDTAGMGNLQGQWYLERLPSQFPSESGPLLQVVPLELRADGSLFGSDGCNHLSGSWMGDGQNLTLRAMQTLMYCEDTSSAQTLRGIESGIHALLGRPLRWSLVAPGCFSPERLLLQDSATGDDLAVFVRSRPVPPVVRRRIVFQRTGGGSMEFSADLEGGDSISVQVTQFNFHDTIVVQSIPRASLGAVLDSALEHVRRLDLPLEGSWQPSTLPTGTWLRILVVHPAGDSTAVTNTSLRAELSSLESIVRSGISRPD
jgi:hypothetical protein